MKKAIILLLVMAILGFLGWKVYEAYTREVSEARRMKEKPRVAVEVTPVGKADIQDVGTFTGTLRPKSLFLIAPKVSGRLERLMVNIGDQLKPSQLIAVLDDDEFKLQLQQAQAYLDVAKANLEAAIDQMEAAKRELERTQSLQQKNLVSASELDKAKTDYASQLSKYRVATAQLEEKTAAYEVSRIHLSYTTITNIWSDSGAVLVVGERFVDEGALVGSTTPVVSILDISSLVGVIHVTEMDYFKIKLGQEAEITVDALPDRQFKGSVIRVSPLIKEKSREAQIDLVIPNDDGILKPGLFIRASIRFGVHQGAPVIPVNALVKRDNENGVFLLDEETDQVHFIKIKTGFKQNEMVEIASPRINGSVVTLGHHLLEDGSSVSVPGKEEKNPEKKKQMRKQTPEKK
ncbi:efflux RND transporter periplasmic adaptor subunit [bacterium]|nr:efflux RND transporter periplasmic adaptor subunit [bacterium]